MLLSSSRPSQFAALRKSITNKPIRKIMEFYAPLSEQREIEIWNKCRDYRSKQRQQAISIPEDERVEDAGLIEAA